MQTDSKRTEYGGGIMSKKKCDKPCRNELGGECYADHCTGFDAQEGTDVARVGDIPVDRYTDPQPYCQKCGELLRINFGVYACPLRMSAEIQWQDWKVPRAM